MSTPALGAGTLTLPIRGTAYPVLLPTLRDARLHLAAVIVSLQVLGQVSFGFTLSIAQIVFRRQRVIMWPASALLTGNGVAFVLRVPGTEHGDWWSLRGWWIFAGAAAVALLSKHVIRFRGGHVFNPSNIGLVVFFLALGASRADPLALWWGPMSPWLALALGIIVAGGFAILGRLHLVEIAVGFWLAFAAGAAILAASGHEMTAAWHLGAIADWEFWRVLVFSPEVLVFLFFMITDPKTIPAGRAGRRAYSVGIGLLAVLLIAPLSTEFGTKVALLGALALVCVARPLAEWLGSARGLPREAARARRWNLAPAGATRRAALAATALSMAAAFASLVVLAGIPARPSEAASVPAVTEPALPDVTIVASDGFATELDRGTALQIARDVVADLRIEAEALSRRDLDRATSAAGGSRLQMLWQQIREAGRTIAVPEYDIERMRIGLEPRGRQGPPLVVATLEGTMTITTYGGSPPAVERRTGALPFEGTFEVALEGGRYLLVGSRGVSTGGLALPAAGGVIAPPVAATTGG